MQVEAAVDLKAGPADLATYKKIGGKLGGAVGGVLMIDLGIGQAAWHPYGGLGHCGRLLLVDGELRAIVVPNLGGPCT